MDAKAILRFEVLEMHWDLDLSPASIQEYFLVFRRMTLTIEEIEEMILKSIGTAA